MVVPTASGISRKPENAQTDKVFGTLDGTRTRVHDVKGHCPRPLDDKSICISRYVVEIQQQSKVHILNHPSSRNQDELMIER